MPERVQLRRARGYRKPTDAVMVARPGPFGNPFIVGDWVCIPTEGGMASLDAPMTPEVAVALFRSWLNEPEQSELYNRIVNELRGKDLACWCPLHDEDGIPVPCHADVLLEIANAG